MGLWLWLAVVVVGIVSSVLSQTISVTGGGSTITLPVIQELIKSYSASNIEATLRYESISSERGCKFFHSLNFFTKNTNIM